MTGADSFGQLSNGILNSIISGIVYWLIVAIVMGILFIITGFLIIGIGYQVGKIYRKDYCIQSKRNYRLCDYLTPFRLGK